MTTWNSSLHCPSLLAVVSDTWTPQIEHLMFVREAGLGHEASFGSRDGSRSK